MTSRGATRFLYLFLLIAAAACANKKTIDASWDPDPKLCDLPATRRSEACTPLPQALPPQWAVEAGKTPGPAGTRMQYYRLVDVDAEVEYVFVHGLFGRSSNFRKLFSHPLPGANYLTYDRPGYEKSPSPLPTPTLAFQVEELNAVLQHTGDLPRILVGHSYGAAVALTAALDPRNHIRGVVLLGGIFDPDHTTPFLVQKWLDLAFISRLLPPELRSANRETLVLKEGLRALHEQLCRIDFPVYAVHGGKDDVVSSTNIAYLEGALLGCGNSQWLHTKIWPDLGHFLPDHNPQMVLEAMQTVSQRIRKN